MQSGFKRNDRNAELDAEFYFLKMHVLDRRSQCTRCLSTQHLNRFNLHGENGDQHMIRLHSTAFSYKSQCSFQPFFVQPGHGTVCTDENHAVIIFRANAGDKKALCNYLASKDRDFQTFRNKAVELLNSIQSRAEERSHQSQEPQQHFLGACNIYGTSILTATATSTSCKGIHLNNPRDSDTSKPGHPTCSVEQSDNQRTAAATQRGTDFLCSC